MLGLTVDKLLVVLLVAAVVIGPTRLPAYAHRLAELVRAARRTLDTARTQARHELGTPLGDTDWQSLDPRRYDPRRIIRDALSEPAAPAPPPGAAAARGTVDRQADDTENDQAAATGAADAADPTGAVPSRRTWVVSGTSGHPRRAAARVPDPAPFPAPAPEPPGDDDTGAAPDGADAVSLGNR